MARPLRIEFPGAVHHVTSRGDRRDSIFEDDVNRLALLDVLGSGLERFDGCALAWCFMGNHDHFVLQTRQPNLSLPMRHINGVYTQRFNQRHRKVGHWFQGRFKAVLVDRAAVWGYLLGEDARNDALAKKAGRAYADLVAPAIAQHRPGIAAVCQRFRVCGVSLPSFRQRVRAQAMAPQWATPHELT